MGKGIEIENMTKLYKNGRGVRNISLTVEEGDILGLLGPNGSGKTTVMKACLGLNRPSAGSVRIFGKDTGEHFEEIMRNTGALIESPAIFKDMTAWKHLEMLAQFYPGVDKARMEKVLDLVHLLPYKNDKAGRFSLGMKQRLGLAMAFLAEPALLVLDEPVNGLDIEGVVEVRELIHRMNQELHATFLISSHMAAEIEKTCNKVAVMYEGELIAVSKTETVLLHYPSVEDYFLSVVREKRGSVAL